MENDFTFGNPFLNMIMMSSCFHSAIFLAILIFVIPLHSFGGNGSGISGGLKIGVQTTRLNGSAWEEQYRVNLNGGAFLAVRGKTLGVQIEGNYNQANFKTGSQFKDFVKPFFNDLKDSLKQGSFKVSALTVPLLFMVRPFGKFWVLAGPEYSMLLHVDDQQRLIKDAQNIFKSQAVNAVLGLWWQYSKHVNMGGRYVYAMTDLNNSTIQQAWGMHSVQLHVGVNF